VSAGLGIMLSTQVVLARRLFGPGHDEKVILAAIHGGVDVGLQLTNDQLKSAGGLVFGKNLMSHKGEVW
jgi:hypothetical protein